LHGWLLSQGFRESEASSIDIPNISYETFTAMMRYIYVGSVEVEQELAMPLLQVRYDSSTVVGVLLLRLRCAVAVWGCAVWCGKHLVAVWYGTADYLPACCAFTTVYAAQQAMPAGLDMAAH
jgi:hypothetical protein